MSQHEEEAPYRNPVIEFYKQFVDRAAIRENLKLTVEERFDKLVRLQEAPEEHRQAGRDAEKEAE